MSTTLPFQDFYERHAEDMDTKWKDFTQVQCDWLLNRLKILFPPEKSFSVLDLGCGTGEMLSQISAIFPNADLTGIDGSQHMIRIASQKLGNKAKIIKEDLTDFAPSKKYDVVISTTVLHHLPSPSDHMTDIHKMLKEDGHVFVSELAINTVRLFISHLWWSWTHKSHHYAWSENDFRYFIKSCDFNIINGAILSPDEFWRVQMYHLQV